MTNRKEIVIIGAGLSGLSAASLLAKAGFNVKVIEKNDQPGGVSNRFSEKGYSFDTGPTWYLMPEVFEQFFSLFNKKSSDYYNLTQLDPSYRVFFNKNHYVDIKKDKNHTVNVFNELENGGGEKLKKYLRDSEYKYNVAYNDFLYRDYKSIFDFFNRKLLLSGTKLHLFNNLDSYAKKYFKNKKARQILEFNTVFLGCSPDRTPALYSLMSHADITTGVFYPEGGIYKLIDALYSLAKENGVKFYLNHNAEKINIHNNKVESIKTNNGSFKADIALVASDYHFAETQLIERKYQTYHEKYWDKRVLSPAVFLIFIGLKKKISILQHHNLYLSENWDNHFESIFKTNSWPDNPSYYIGCNSKTDPGSVPLNCESLFILVPVAPELDDSEEIREKFYNTIISHIEYLTGENIIDSIRFKKIFAHKDFIKKFNSYKGTSMGLAHTLFQTAVFRPSHKSKKVSNLFYTGQYTHPGIGMPMVIISSQVVSDLIKEKYA